MLRAVRTGAVLCLLLVAATAHADDGATMRVTYAAPPACPDVGAFRASLDARVAQAPSAPSARFPGSIDVRIEPSPGTGYRGTLRVRDTDGTVSARQVGAAACDELVDALAFVTALTMGLAPPPPPPRPPPPRPPEPAVLPTPVPLRPVPGPARGQGGWRVGLGVDATALSFVGPEVRFGAEPYLALALDTRHLFAPAFRLEGVFLGSETIQPASGGIASLTFTAGRVEACPIRWRPVPRVGLVPCAAMRAGVLRGVGTAIPNAKDTNEPWLSVEAAGRVEWEILDWLIVEAQGGGSVPLFRYEFYFVPTPGAKEDLHQTPAVGWFASAGAGVRFP